MKNYRWMTMLMIFVIMIIGCNNNENKTQNSNNSLTRVETFLVQPQVISEIIKASGSVQPNEKMELRSEIAGRVTELNFKEGTKIEKGNLLIQIDDSELKAQLQKYNAQMRIAREDENRKKQLLAINGISQEIYDAALAKVEELEADIALTNSKIRKSKIEAPFSGTVGLRYVSPGAWVSQGEIISTLVQSDPVKVEFTVPEKYAPYITNGMEVEFTVAGRDNTFTAKVYATEPRIDANTRALRVRALTPNPDGELIPGAFAELTLNLRQTKDALMIPTLCLVPLLNSQNVFVISNGTARLMEIETGIRQERLIQVVSGLSAGDTIATTALLALKDNMPVQVKKSGNR